MEKVNSTIACPAMNASAPPSAGASPCPVLGQGLGAFENGVRSVQSFEYDTKYAHNHYIQTLAETGLVGLALFLGLLGISARWIWRGRRHQPLDRVLVGPQPLQPVGDEPRQQPVSQPHRPFPRRAGVRNHRLTWEGEGEVQVVIESQNREQAMMHTSTQLYRGTLDQAEFTAPEDSLVVWLRFTAQTPAQMGRVSYAGAHPQRRQRRAAPRHRLPVPRQLLRRPPPAQPVQHAQHRRAAHRARQRHRPRPRPRRHGRHRDRERAHRRHHQRLRHQKQQLHPPPLPRQRQQHRKRRHNRRAPAHAERQHKRQRAHRQARHMRTPRPRPLLRHRQPQRQPRCLSI